jgi:multiple sugar transport system ATP-binding protein
LTGYETQVTARLGGQDFVCVFRERFGGRPGENVALSLNGGPPHFFDAESGWAIAGR